MDGLITLDKTGIVKLILALYLTTGFKRKP